VAAHYGCHALRPRSVVRYDHPFSPMLFEKLIQITGAECVPWTRRLECCGQPVAEKNTGLSMKLLEKKIESAFSAGADFICTACTYCQMQLDLTGEIISNTMVDSTQRPPSILFPQLLGLSMGLDETSLGLEKNRTRAKDLKNYL